MAKPVSNRPSARVPRGFRDIDQAELRAEHRMLATIREVYESYGFEALETPAIEYTDALGKFLPDQDRPNEGVFSFQDDDEQWLSLRYDLTAPLARYVAEGLKAQTLSLPFRRYATGPVWRNEKPGPGRFRQFTQFDADTVGTDNVAADAEICMLAADTLERLGVKRGDYRIKVNNRKLLDGLLELAGVDPDSPDDAGRRLTVLRAMDKFDKFGPEGVRQLLGRGRKDESGDFTKGAGLGDVAANIIVEFLSTPSMHNPSAAYLPRDNPELANMKGGILVGVPPTLAAQGRQLANTRYVEGMKEIDQIRQLVETAGYGPDQICFDPSVVRGLEYYTGPVFEAELTFEVKGEDGAPVRFGSVGGGGRYDGLVERFTGQKVPATGFSIGVSRLAAALRHLKKNEAAPSDGPVVVLVMDKAELPRYQRMAKTLRDAGVRAEMYLGTAGMKAQMKYADKRGSPCVVIQGSNEREKGEVQIKDLVEGAKAAAAIKDNKEWKETRAAQVSVPEAGMVAAVQEILARHR